MLKIDARVAGVAGSCADLEAVFRRCFLTRYGTVLLPAPREPLYLPAARAGDRHRVYYVDGHFSSALHEVAHWCIAGARRRLLEDYGYWYVPDGRSAAEQRAFEQVEVCPQAMEWVFSLACGHRFHLSADNLTGESDGDDRFASAVREQVGRYAREGLPARAATFYRALCLHYGVTPQFGAAALPAGAATL